MDELKLPTLTNRFVLRITGMKDEEENVFLRERYPDDDSDIVILPVFESEEDAKEVVRHFKEDLQHKVKWEIVPIVVMEVD
jgi:hypothetical protein